MTAVRRLLILLGLVLFILFPLVSNGAAQNVPESILSLTVAPTPIVVGNSVKLMWDSDVVSSGVVSFDVYIPVDWYDTAEWKSGTGVVVVSTLTEKVYSTSACTDTTINGVSVICARIQAVEDLGMPVESIELSFMVKSNAVKGSDRPVRVLHSTGSNGPPNIATTFVTVADRPSTRYIAAEGGCGSYSPCDTGPGALSAAISNLPAEGGTVIVIGELASYGSGLGGKKVVMTGLDASAVLKSVDYCTAMSSLLVVEGSAELTVQALTLDGTGSPCDMGIAMVAETGKLTINNQAMIRNWSCGVYFGNGVGLVENSQIKNSGQGLFVEGGTVAVRGNLIENNAGYGLRVKEGSTTTIYANNFIGNNSGGFQALLDSQATAAKNWWGSAHNPAVGSTTDGLVSDADSWARRLGARVSTWAAGTGSVSLGGAGMSGGSGVGVIVGFGRGSSNAPFGNGVTPFVNRTCSQFYDFYGLTDATGWSVYTPVDEISQCDLVRYNEIVYTINPANYAGPCTEKENPGCWDPIPAGQVTLTDGKLQITGLDLSWTHVVAGDHEGTDPTAISLESFTAYRTGSRYLLPVLILGLLAFSGAGGVAVWRRWKG